MVMGLMPSPWNNIILIRETFSENTNYTSIVTQAIYVHKYYNTCIQYGRRLVAALNLGV